VGAVALVAGSRAVAEDAVQEALARAWERTERGEDIDSLPAWVTRTAMNLSRSAFRRLRAELRARERPAASAPTAEAAGAEVRADLARALAALPRRQREVVGLHYHLGLPVGEVAGTLGVSEGTVKTSLHRARRALARALRPDEDTADVAPR
jgi:RNA polymerase sigma-70 factor (ECF subfamily)